MAKDGKINDPVTYKIIGCAMNVHNELGNGFQELIYQRSLSYEMELRGLNHQREVEMPLFYKELSVGSRRVDFIVEDTVMLELKAVIKLENVHLAQALNYLRAYQLEKGLLINFGGTRLEYKLLFPR